MNKEPETQERRVGHVHRVEDLDNSTPTGYPAIPYVAASKDCGDCVRQVEEIGRLQRAFKEVIAIQGKQARTIQAREEEINRLRAEAEKAAEINAKHVLNRIEIEGQFADMKAALRAADALADACDAAAVRLTDRQVATLMTYRAARGGKHD